MHMRVHAKAHACVDKGHGHILIATPISSDFLRMPKKQEHSTDPDVAILSIKSVQELLTRSSISGIPTPCAEYAFVYTYVCGTPGQYCIILVYMYMYVLCTNTSFIYSERRGRKKQ